MDKRTKLVENAVLNENQLNQNIHDFHIPVMGTAFTIDSPYKVARFGISSVVSIGDDELCEVMRKYYMEAHNLNYTPINKKDDVDYRAKRITAYLDLLEDLIQEQINNMKTSSFEKDSKIFKDVISALNGLGYKEKETEKALKQLDINNSNQTIENLIREVLKILNG